MKTSIKIDYILLLLIPIVLSVFFYWSATYLKEAGSNLPPEQSFALAKSSQDIEEIRELLVISLNAIKDTTKGNIELLYDFLYVILATSFLSIVLTISIYTHYHGKASNKSSNLTGEKDSPSS